MTEKDPLQVLYHLSKTIENQSSAISSMQQDINSIKTDIAIMKVKDKVTMADMSRPRKQRVQDTGIGSAIGGVIVAIFVGIWEYLKK